MASFIITQGEDAGITWSVYDAATKLPVNFVGWTGETQLRSVTTDRLIYTFSTSAGNMLLGDGKVTLLWNKAVTIDWSWNEAKYGVELTNPDGKSFRFKQGIVTLSKEVTK